jgi:hypothetical protein
MIRRIRVALLTSIDPQGRFHTRPVQPTDASPDTAPAKPDDDNSGSGGGNGPAA